ncbi:collagen-like protein [Candidatus Saccharibacteria bacterium]|nr:collagen-like protein [Candidatus Saccharibacteria bacterium]
MSDPIEFNVSLNEPVNFNLEVGDQGPKGDEGDTGSKGETGDRGEKGDPGTTDYNQLQNKPQLDIYLKKSEANTTTADLLNKINQNTDSINDTKSSLRNYALTSDVNGSISEAKTELNEKISQAETRINNAISQAKIEINGKFTEADNKTSSLDTKFTKLTSDNKADITQLRANLNFTNSALSTHKEQVDKNLDDIKVEQTDQDTLISDILNAFSAESDKGTNLKLNTSATKMLGMTIYGNTEQINYVGKNLINIISKPESNGVNFSITNNNYIKAIGTITQNWATLPFAQFNLAPGVYTLSREGQNNCQLSIDSNTNGNHNIVRLAPNEPSKTFTVSTYETNCYLVYNIAKNTKVDITARIMVELGDTATSYEPYTGGVTNLFDGVSGLPVTVDGLTLKQKDGMIECTGTTTKDNVRFQEKNISDILENNNAYTIYADTATSVLRLTVRLKRKDNNNYEYYNTIDNNVSTFTWNTAVYSEAYIYLVTGEKAFWNGSNSVASRFGLFKGGSFDGNDYAPVGMNKPTFGEIKGVSNTTIYTQNKNLFDTRFGERTINGVSVKTYPDGSFELNGTPTNGFSLTNVFGSKSYVPSGSYKIKAEIISGSVQKIEPSAKFLCVYTIQSSSTGSNSGYIREADIVSGNIKEFTNTVNNPKTDINTPYIWIPYHIENKKAFYSYNNLRMRATLVPNGENTDFVEFKNNSLSASLPMLHKVGNYQDRIYTKDNRWYLEKNTATKILNGSENWIKTAELENIFICQNIINATKNYDDAYFSHFSNIKRYPNIDKTGAIRGDNGTNVAFCMSNIRDIAGLKNWLNQNNVTVLNPINQPITTEITDPAVLAELKKLMGMRTYDGTTNISITGTDLTPEIKVKYMRKIN